MDKPHNLTLVEAFKIALLVAVIVGLMIPSIESTGQISSSSSSFSLNNGFLSESGCSTGSFSFVGSGNGVKLTTKNHGNITAWISGAGEDTGVTTGTIDYAMYYSTIGILACGSAVTLQASDIQLSSIVVSSTLVGDMVGFSLLGSKINVASGTVFYIYMAEAVGSATNNVFVSGQILVIES